MQELNAIRDSLQVQLSRRAPVVSREFVRGHGVAKLWSPEGDLLELVEFDNLVTEVGDAYYGDAGAGLSANATVADPNGVTGMRLGTGTTAPAKTGAGAAIVTYIAGSSIAIDGAFPTSTLSGSSRRIAWRTTWAAGVATNAAIAEVVITNETPLTDVAGTAANTISRAVFGTAINKGSGDTLEVTWNHDLLGA